ncbi:MAG: hypothetical protein ACTSO7_06355 [Candidatus Heimdallarchaeota archaeon]
MEGIDTSAISEECVTSSAYTKLGESCLLSGIIITSISTLLLILRLLFPYGVVKFTFWWIAIGVNILVVFLFVLLVISCIKFRNSVLFQDREKFLSFFILFSCALVFVIADVVYNIPLLLGIQRAFENLTHRDVPSIANIFFLCYVLFMSISFIFLGAILNENRAALNIDRRVFHTAFSMLFMAIVVILFFLLQLFLDDLEVLFEFSRLIWSLALLAVFSESFIVYRMILSLCSAQSEKSS